MIHFILFDLRDRGLAKKNFFFQKDQTVNISSFVGHTALSQFCDTPFWHESSHKQFVDKWAWLHCNKSLFIETQGGPYLASGLWFAGPCARLFLP